MKKSLLVIVSCVMVLCLSAIAYSDEGTQDYAGRGYMGINAGLAMMRDAAAKPTGMEYVDEEWRFKTGFIVSLTGGYHFNKLRFETEISYQKNELDEVYVESGGESLTLNASGNGYIFSVLANLYYDFYNQSSITPFICGGIGPARVVSNDVSFPDYGFYQSGSDDDLVFAYHVGGGIGIEATDAITIDLKYRYFGTTDASIEGGEIEISSHNFIAGIRFRF